MANIMKKNNLLDAYLNNNGDIFEEIKKLRRTTPTAAPTMDGVNSKIESHFANKFGDTCSSSDYRSIALSILFLKISDWILILLFDNGMKIDELQFGFQRKTSTTMCS